MKCSCGAERSFSAVPIGTVNIHGHYHDRPSPGRLTHISVSVEQTAYLSAAPEPGAYAGQNPGDGPQCGRRTPRRVWPRPACHERRPRPRRPRFGSPIGTAGRHDVGRPAVSPRRAWARWRAVSVGRGRRLVRRLPPPSSGGYRRFPRASGPRRPLPCPHLNRENAEGERSGFPDLGEWVLPIPKLASGPAPP